MRIIQGKNFAELYNKVMDNVYNNFDYETAPRGQKIRECINVAMVIEDPYDNLFKFEDKTLTLPSKYTKKEMCLYLNATDKLSLFEKASPFWKKIANDDGTVNSAYGNLIFNSSLDDGRSQFDWAFDCLKADRDSRQAFMRFNNMQHQHAGVKDLPCTFIMMFHIRNNALHATIDMRSNDIVKGLIHDEPSFVLFQHLMLLRLREVYPELQMGTYTHISHSLHLYEPDFDLTKKRLDSQIIPNHYPMPNDWRVVKSTDAAELVEDKVCGQQFFAHDWQLKENLDFYSWILS